MLSDNPCSMRKYFDSASSEWNSSEIDQKLQELQVLVNEKNASILKLSVEMIDYCNKESSKNIKPMDLVLSMSKLLDAVLKKDYLQEHVSAFRLTFLLRKDNLIIAPTYEKEIKTFTFHNGVFPTKGRNITSMKFKSDMFIALIESIHLNEYVIELFPSKYEVFLSSISFDVGDETCTYSYIDEDYINDYWMSEPKHFLDEEHGRIELDNYKFDDYKQNYGFDNDNFKFSI
ncbi:hypothetical protein [Sulfurimonas sp.]|jgi:hypothetical protein|uniref:hypothetical protein n=1 Tax=Sulfurimonas sp. TaxID=2022749 RepID=UPI0025D0C89D|nr:hypothetical protein [Sulfurimonas sp.]MBT5935592.1 hypothetical protein [Sulfurimonas sp.]